MALNFDSSRGWLCGGSDSCCRFRLHWAVSRSNSSCGSVRLRSVLPLQEFVAFFVNECCIFHEMLLKFIISTRVSLLQAGQLAAACSREMRALVLSNFLASFCELLLDVFLGVNPKNITINNGNVEDGTKITYIGGI